MGAGIFLIIIGFISLIFSVKIIRKNSHLKHWPKTIAKITRKEIVHTQKAVKATPAFRYEVEVEYEYKVDGKSYKGDKYSPNAPISDTKSCQKMLDKLMTTMDIYYNPDDPEESYIFTDAAWMGILIAFSSLLMVLFGLGIALT